MKHDDYNENCTDKDQCDCNSAGAKNGSHVNGLGNTKALVTEINSEEPYL